MNMKGTASEDWVKMAMADDSLVVDVLLGIRKAEQYKHQPPKPLRMNSHPPALKLEWSVRQRRSKSLTRSHEKEKNKDEQTHASPTTPLSWSGATSISGGIDGFEESTSKPLARSKPTCLGIHGLRKLLRPRASHVTLFEVVIAQAPVKSEATTSKRPRKKKTLAELKDEENFLLNEGRILNNELAALRLTVEKERASNESLKRLKLDLLCQQTTKAVTSSAASGEETPSRFETLQSVSEPTKISATALHGNDIDALQLVCPRNVPCEVQEAAESKDNNLFLVPDLNLPVEEDCSS